MERTVGMGDAQHMKPSSIEWLYSRYLDAFACSMAEKSESRIRLGYEGTSLVPRRLDMEEFKQWIVDFWNNEDLKASWLESFLTESELELAQPAIANLQSSTVHSTKERRRESAA